MLHMYVVILCMLFFKNIMITLPFHPYFCDGVINMLLLCLNKWVVVLLFTPLARQEGGGGMTDRLSLVWWFGLG